MKFRGFVAFALIALFGAGCTSGGDTAPSSAPSPTLASTSPVTTPASTTAAPSPSVATTGPNVKPGEKPPVLSDVAKTNTRYGAVAFAQYWFQALDWGYATTDSTLAKMLYLPQCTDCAKFMRTFDDAKASGQSFRGGRLHVTTANVVSGDKRHPGSTPVDVTLSQDRLVTEKPDATELGVDPAVSGIDYRVWLVRRGQAWAVLDYKQVVDK